MFQKTRSSQNNAANQSYVLGNAIISVYPIYENRKYLLVPTTEIVYIEASGSYCKIHVVDSENKVKAYVKSVHLREVERQLKNLANGAIVRCHRQYLVNIHWITSIEPGRRGGLIAFRKPVTDVIPYSNTYESFLKLLP